MKKVGLPKPTNPAKGQKFNADALRHTSGLRKYDWKPAVPPKGKTPGNRAERLRQTKPVKYGD